MIKPRSALLVLCAFYFAMGNPTPVPLQAAPQSPRQPQSQPRNFGDQFPQPTNDRCFRLPKFKTKQARGQATCTPGYHQTNGLCWPECPVQYPVKCGPGCLVQGKTCRGDNLELAVQVAWGVANVASAGLLKLLKEAMTVHYKVMCGYHILRALGEGFKMAKSFTGTPDALKKTLLESPFAQEHLPAAIGTCIGVYTPVTFLETNIQAAQRLYGTVEAELTTKTTPIVGAIVDLISKARGTEIKTPDQLLAFLKTNKINIRLDNLTADEKLKISNALTEQANGNVWCAGAMRNLIQELTTYASKQMATNPQFSKDQVHFDMATVPLYYDQIPRVAGICYPEANQAKNREELISALGFIAEGIADQAVKAKSTKFLRRAFLGSMFSAGLDLIPYFFPPAQLVTLLGRWKSVCRPTVLLGEATDGPITNLGLKILDSTFAGTTGAWKNAGDGMAILSFVNTSPKYTAKIHVRSGGYEIPGLTDFELPKKPATGNAVPTPKTVPLTALQGRALYFEVGPCWRDFGSPSGTMLLWVPVLTGRGSLKMDIRVTPNPSLATTCKSAMRGTTRS
ncbi:hypothetical protein Poli38472_001947 [Pythium oligandrum]|uniref:Uncharacterized protein n=1 Tax=Pythium oligandrum TaxID=41045 RepID=A0A8K1CWB2_PYTOL|nr:hypothetical protein Poli38472_001947 [Pythium oligandrum]|eukprot:TMW69791.1 hypothetical protein Poli38472_001947 [Pythium oligandrum]